MDCMYAEREHRDVRDEEVGERAAQTQSAATLIRTSNKCYRLD